MCMNNSMCGCANNNNCTSLGPFIAVDAACITTPAPTTGTMVPFSSGTVPVILATLAGGLVGTTSLVGFGTAIPGVSLVGTNIDLSAATGTEAFSVPRAGSITSISAYLSATAALNLIGGTATVRAQIYRAVAGTNVFNPTTAFVDLTPALSTIAIGTITSGTANVAPVPVAAGDRLLMVYSVTTTGIAAVTTIEGNASAGINIV
ncbi:exosporium glycoprotein BclB-related protein [Viridibacillus sp. FSL H8-0110]|uniref:exosporium glycoprotein BclB-related protein n=1 Tax=Viridibacillus sp. FSL H8-0110 TaxID=2921376 RepID=UPI0030F58146